MLSRSDAQELSFRAGSSIKGNGGTVHAAIKVLWHPKYNSWEIDYDYALVQVEQPFPIGSAGVQAIKPTETEPAAGTSTVVTGWGSLSVRNFLVVFLTV